MPCIDAMLKKEKVITASPEQTVAETLELFEKNEIRSVPVVDANGELVGLFNFLHLLKSILPVPVTLDGDNDTWLRLRHLEISLDHLAGSSPWVAQRLELLLPKKLETVMIKNPHFVHSETPLREGVRLITKYGSPLPVVNEETHELVGIVTSQKVVSSLAKIAKSVAEGNKVDE